MIYYRFPDKRRWKLLFAVFLFAMLFLARDTLLTTSVMGFNTSQFLMLGLICGYAVAFLAVNRRRWKEIFRDRRLLAVILFSLILLVPMLVKRDWQLMYFSVLLCLYFAVFLTYFIPLQELAKYYVVILSLLGLYSVLATYLLRLPVDSGLLSVPVFYNPLGVKFHNFGLAFVSDSYVKNRNFGIFREPGVYQFFILIALLLNNDTVSWKKQSHMWLVNGILAVTMLSTFATGGIIEMGLLTVILFLDKKWYRDKRIVTVAVVGIALLAAVLCVSIIQKNTLYWELYGMTVDKFSGNTESMSERTEAILADLQIFLRHPFFGERLATVLHGVANNTTSTLILYAVFGAVGGTLNVAGWVALVWRKERGIWANLALTVVLFMSFNTQNLIADVFFWLFPAVALVERGLPVLDKRKKKV